MPLIACPECRREVSDAAPACPHCGNPNPSGYAATPAVAVQDVRYFSPGVAFLLSIIPGAGHLYKGDVIHGILWFLFTGVGYTAFVLPGIILHFCCALHSMKADAVAR